MRILICTQVMDKKDSALGFFQKWVASLAPHYEGVEVICLKEGDHSLPSNVRVHSLGKETSAGLRFMKRFRYVIRFYSLIWNLRKNYDIVFVHMNQEYILLGGFLWKLFSKKIFMWRNHYDGSILTDIAATFCEKVFCTSKFSYTARYKKTVLMPVGVDEESAHMDESIARTPRSILFLGGSMNQRDPMCLLKRWVFLRTGDSIYCYICWWAIENRFRLSRKASHSS